MVSPKMLGTVILNTVSTTTMIYFIIIGAAIFSPFLALTQIPESLAAALNAMEFGPIVLLIIVLLAFIVLGTFLDGFAMMVLILPIVLPIIEQSQVPNFLELRPDSSDFKVWFGVIMVVILEMALISPPVGMNVFVVKGGPRCSDARYLSWHPSVLDCHDPLSCGARSIPANFTTVAKYYAWLTLRYRVLEMFLDSFTIS